MPTPDRTPSTWHLSPEQRRVLLGRRLTELRAWQDRALHELPVWTFTFPGDAPVPLRLGDPWPRIDAAVSGGPVRLETTFTVPAGFEGCELELDVGGEGLVRLSTGAAGGLNPHHRRFGVDAQAGQQVSVVVEAVPKGLFGAHHAGAGLRVARLARPEPEVTGLADDLEALLGVVQGLEEQHVAAHLLSAAEDALAGLAWPSALAAYQGRPDAFVGADMGALWTLPPASAPLPLDEAVIASVRAVREALHKRLEALRAAFPPSGALALSAHAHLDLAWLWPIAETRRKAVRTFETVLGLMEQFPDFTFNQSSAQLYAWIEEDQPDLFARIRERVRQDRWEAVGGMWVEPDCAMSGGESLSRQLLYGQRYFQEKFGRRSAVAWLPDTFGFSGALPQLLLQGGIGGFFTTKLSWNETSPFPHDLWWWEGLDGSRVLAHTFKNDVYGEEALGSYNGDISPEHLLRVTRHDRAASAPGWAGRAPETLFTFGLGDGAGGPSAGMLRRYGRLNAYPAMPGLRHSRVDDFFTTLPRSGLPVWVGELYFQLHRGTLSTQGRIKRLHRQLEARLVEADAALALARWGGQDVAPAHGELERHWKTHLLHEFHDLLPGSSIREVYAEAEPTLQAALDGATAVRDGAQAGSGEGFTLWNASLFPRPLRAVVPVTVDGMEVDGRAVPTQAVEGGTLVAAPDITVPPLGSVTLRVGQGTVSLPHPATLEETPEGIWLGNGLLRVLVTPDGQLSRLVTAAGREALGAQGHRLVTFHDLPRAWEAWDVNPDTQDAALGEALPDGTVTVLERGPLRASVRVSTAWRDSTVIQTIRITAGSGRVDIHTGAHWQERRTLLKAFVDVNARAETATFETAFGVQRRPTHRNQPSDAAQFEGSGHRFADLSEPGFGLSVLNDGRYGHSALGSKLGLTLLRGSLYPDPLADVGEHEFTYSLLPHGGDWTQGGVLAEAGDLNAPLVVWAGTGSETSLPVRLEGLQVALGTLKGAEDGGGLILRVYEPFGARGELQLLADPGVQVTRVNLLEDALEDTPAQTPVQTQPGCWTVSVRPFEVLSFRILRSAGPSPEVRTQNLPPA